MKKHPLEVIPTPYQGKISFIVPTLSDILITIIWFRLSLIQYFLGPFRNLTILKTEWERKTVSISMIILEIFIASAVYTTRNVLMQVRENKIWGNLMFVDGLQETAFIRLVYKKSWQSTYIKPVDNLQQTCYHQAGASDLRASRYRLVDHIATTQPETPQVWCKLWILSAWCKYIIKLHQDCSLHPMKNLHNRPKVELRRKNEIFYYS